MPWPVSKKTIRDQHMENKLITILGPTATGKTSLAASLAAAINGEVISADSRQVYRGMDLGTGKDLEDYIVDGLKVPYHLIDIAEPGEEYNVYRFQRDFIQVFRELNHAGHKAIMCGGTGMYLESVILPYRMKDVPENERMRADLNKLSDEELCNRLGSLRELHNITDTGSRERMIRAIEIANAGQSAKMAHDELSLIRHSVFGISLSREEIRSRITRRLKQRLDEGMLDEIRSLLDRGISPEELEFYGLEYKYLTQHVRGAINYNDMFQRLNSAIHQFAKRQMTWFRRMEKRGVNIGWIDGNLSMEEKLNEISKVVG